jgi:hypothetical protein
MTNYAKELKGARCQNIENNPMQSMPLAAAKAT